MWLQTLTIFSIIPGVEAVGVAKKKKRIRRESLRQYYGNSINSPNLTEVPRAVIKVRRSPRLAGDIQLYVLLTKSIACICTKLIYSGIVCICAIP